ncbi:unnamed protein product [Peniophora sp. CBMAI 1063]|nr:unnamed protein product [Peniophora sp. CBMAI 1063]
MWLLNHGKGHDVLGVLREDENTVLAVLADDISAQVGHTYRAIHSEQLCGKGACTSGCDTGRPVSFYLNGCTYPAVTFVPYMQQLRCI